MIRRRSHHPVAAAGGAAALWLLVGAITALLATAGAAQAAPAPTPPLAQTAPISALTDTTVTLNGTVTPVETSALTWFEWGFTADYGRSTTVTQLSGSGEQAVAATLAALLPSTTYHYRLVAANGTGTTRTADETFTTAPSTTTAPGGPAAPDRSAATTAGTSDGASSATAVGGAAGVSGGSTAAPRLPAITIGNTAATGVPTVSTSRVRAPSVRLPVTCASGPTCVGRVAVLVPRKPSRASAATSVSVATAAFTIPSGTRVTLKMAITPAGRALVAAAKRARQTETVSIALDGQAPTRQPIALANQTR